MLKSLKAKIIINAFHNIFVGVADELKVPITDINISIEYRNGRAFYYPYKLDKVKNTLSKVIEVIELGEGKTAEEPKTIELEEYIDGITKGVIDMSGGDQLINLTIGNWGVQFAQKANAEIEDIDLLLKDAGEGNLPYSLLRKKVDGKMQVVEAIDFNLYIN
jgi:hypothetical protein